MTPDLWTLPDRACIGGRTYAIHADFRDILHLLGWLCGARGGALSEPERWYVALGLFYEGFAAMPPANHAEAMRYLADFLACGQSGPQNAGPPLLDWQQDAPLIIAGVNRVAGQEVRALPFLHWWSFIAWFSGIGEGTLATVVAIRDKLRRGKKLEKWELEFYRAHRAEVDLRPRRSEAEEAAAAAEKQRLLARLG